MTAHKHAVCSIWQARWVLPSALEIQTNASFIDEWNFW